MQLLDGLCSGPYEWRRLMMLGSDIFIFNPNDIYPYFMDSDSVAKTQPQN